MSRKYDHIKPLVLEMYSEQPRPTSAEILERLRDAGAEPLPTTRAIRHWCNHKKPGRRGFTSEYKNKIFEMAGGVKHMSTLMGRIVPDYRGKKPDRGTVRNWMLDAGVVLGTSIKKTLPVMEPEPEIKTLEIVKRRTYRTSIKADLYPADHPEYILHAYDSCVDILVKRSPALPGGSRIYAVYNQAKMNPVTYTGTFSCFLSWLEGHLCRSLDLYTERAGRLERVEDEPITLFSGVAA